MIARVALLTIAGLVVLTTTVVGCTRARVEAPIGAPVRGGAPATCASCHSAIAKEWEASLHRAAFTDPTFQRSLALEDPKEHAFCLGCHAPAEGTAGRAVGVDCASCHAHAHAPHGAEDSRRVAGVAGVATCASCHEFAFDDGRADLVQRTVSEHAGSPWAGVACSACHMPVKDGHKDHRFLGGHDPKHAIAKALHVTLTRVQGSAAPSVRVSIRVDAGHAFPTGDMFRRARLLVFAEDASGAIIGDAERIFGRTWGGEAEGPHAGRRKETSDTRIRGLYDEAITFDVAPKVIARLRWSLVYERVIAMRGADIELASSDVVGEGELPW